MVGGPGGGMFPPIMMLGGIAPPIINWEHQAQVTNDLYYYSKGVSTPQRRGEGMQLSYILYRGRNAGGY